jgi:hypothetical protein
MRVEAYGQRTEEFLQFTQRVTLQAKLIGFV